MRAWLAGASAVFMRDFRLWTSYRTRSISTVFSAIAGVTLFYYVSRLVQSPHVGSPDDYFGFVVVGTVTLEILTSTLTTPLATLRAELLSGNLERIVVSPYGPVWSVLALMAFPAVLGLGVALVTLLFATVVFGLALSWPSALGAIPVAGLAILSFVPFGLLMASLALVFKQTNAGAAFIITGLSLVAGLYFPTSLLPDWISWTANVQPFTPATDLLRHLLLGTDMQGSVGIALLKLILFAGVMLPVAMVVLRVSVQHSRRNGTITEY
jgi:ABC-2 type transport system permease protein